MLMRFGGFSEDCSHEEKEVTAAGGHIEKRKIYH